MGLAYDGQFQISGWKCINNPNSSFRLPGTAVIFGYSFDILAGTDWLYSGCFWEWEKQDIPMNDINIYIDGLCRLAGIYIYVNKDLIYNEFNCDSHSEWRPC